MIPSHKMKKVWADCETIGRHLNKSKWQVMNHLYKKIKDMKLLEAAVEGNSEALQQVMALPEYEAIGKVRVHNPNKQQFSSHETVDFPADQLKLAMWFIGKIGDPDIALEAVKLAAAAVKNLGQKQAE